MKCRVCGCTDERACEGGCTWVNGADICSVCQAAIDALLVYLETTYHFSARLLLHELTLQAMAVEILPRDRRTAGVPVVDRNKILLAGGREIKP